MKKWLLAGVLFAFLLTGCGASEESIQTLIANDELSSAVPSPLTTDTPLPTQTLPPTSTSSPVPTNTPTLTQTPEPPAGLIAFIAREEGQRDQICLMNSDGTDVHCPFSPMLFVLNLDWSPQGNWLMFEFVVGSYLGLKIYNPSTGFQRDLLAVSGEGTHHWSPDDRRLAYQSGGGTCNIAIYMPETDEILQLEMGKFQPPYNCDAYFSTMDGWDNKGRYLMLSDQISGSQRLIIMDVEADALYQEIEGFTFYSSAISEEGRYLALGVEQAETSEIHGRAVAIKNIPDNTWQFITVPGELEKDLYDVISWLPDGRLLFGVVHHPVTVEGTSYWYFDPQIDTSPYPAEDYWPPIESWDVIKRLPSNVYLNSWAAKEFSESPDHSRVAVSVNKDGEDGIYVLDWETGKLLGPLALGFSPRWQPLDVESSP